MGTIITHTRELHADDATAVVKLAHKALVELGLLTVDYEEVHFHTFIRRGLIHPGFRGSVGLFANDELIGFTIVNNNTLPWAPKRQTATLSYYYILPPYVNQENSVKLFDAVEDWCKKNNIKTLRISNLNIADESLLKLGFVPEERIYNKDYD